MNESGHSMRKITILTAVLSFFATRWIVQGETIIK